ncbi:urease accessory protein UreF [Nocardioides sp. GY 10113]|uniref:urease accessory protein UreF n=1 Tax=Nocardioides sp. GY 10113 TaxID=2569761 RepID=UPI0010A7CB0C|nr:urease accessory UreF family protein [Nocardioides sp. GY 10113]TIC87673.1 urease accessory protein UreF [Nocardioides sp. GY 10113]
MTDPGARAGGPGAGGVDPELFLLLLADARLPVGGHTQSGTLEGALAHGLGAADVPGFLRARLLGVTRVEAGTAVAARAAVLSGGSLAAVDDAWAARTVAPALREASRQQGRALLMVVERIWPAALPPLAGLDRPARATVLGAVAAHLGLGAATLARLVAYDDVQTVCAAALKLVPLDPFVVTGWVAQALPAVDEVTRAVAEVTDPADVPAVAAPQIEAWAQAHATTTRRLFRA